MKLTDNQKQALEKLDKKMEQAQIAKRLKKFEQVG